MFQKIIDSRESDFEAVIEWFSIDLKNLRTGRATPALVEDLKVDYFGALTPMKQMSSISVVDAKTIVISPWNKDNLVDVEKAIRDSELQLNPVNDGMAIRVVLPSLTEERRKELVKILNKKAEEARIKIRKIREEIWDEIQDKEKNGEIPEDDKFRAKDKLQEVVDRHNDKIEELKEKKEKEIMQI